MQKTLFVWANFGAYHIDRLEAVATQSRIRPKITAIELSSVNMTYAWEEQSVAESIRKVTLTDKPWRNLSLIRRIMTLARACNRANCDMNFLCHYDRLEVFITALTLRLAGRRVYLMNDSKFDDKPRSFIKDAVKRVFHAPYHGALVSGQRAKEYIEYFGMRGLPIERGYDTVSWERLRRLCQGSCEPAYEERHFSVVARLIPKKNILHTLKVYSRYCELAGADKRRLVVCGSGVCEDEAKAFAHEHALNVEFRGFADQKQVADVLSRSLALLLLSKEEQWGLVVNEALALGVPVVVSDQVGARDELVRTNVNGYVVERDNIEGAARFLAKISSDRAEWYRLRQNTADFHKQADVSAFVRGVDVLVMQDKPR